MRTWFVFFPVGWKAANRSEAEFKECCVHMYVPMHVLSLTEQQR